MAQILLAITWLTTTIAGATHDPRAWSTTIEGESALSISKPATIVGWAGASGGRCVRLSGADAPDAFPADGSGKVPLRGSVSLQFTAPASQTYTLWARLQWHCMCSRNISFSTTASTLDAEKCCSGNSISSEVVPRTWHWVKIGAARFSAGPQTIDFTQRGHLALLDTIALSADPAYTPPGYEDSLRDQAFEENVAQWRERENGAMVYSVGEGLFSNFSLSAALKVPPFDSAGPSAGVSFCTQPGGAGYTVHLQATANHGTALRLVKRVEGGGETCLAQAVAENTDSWNAINITHAGPSMHVALNGVDAVSVEDSTYPSGEIMLIASGVERVPFEYLHVRPLACYGELFGDDWVAWPSVNGTWRLVDAGENERDGRHLLGTSETAALIMAPWKFGDCYSFSTDISPIKGTAGIAFNVKDKENFSAIVVASPADSQTEEMSLCVVTAEAGSMQTQSLNAPAANKGQWQRLTLNRDGSGITFEIDGRRLHGYDMRDWDFDGKLGLFVGNGGASLFARIDGHETAPARPDLFSFERSMAVWSICHWECKRGRPTLAEHPDLLLLLPQEGQICFELRRPVESSVMVHAVLPLRTADNSLADEQQGEPPLSFPSLPFDSCFGIRLIGQNGIDKCEAIVDCPALHSIRLVHNGTVLDQKVLPPTRNLSEVTLYLRLEQGRMEAGMEGIASIAAADLPVDGIDGPLRVGLIGSNMQSQQEVKISEVTVTELHPLLGEITSSTAAISN